MPKLLPCFTRKPSHRLSAWVAAVTLAVVPLAACRHNSFPEYPADYREFAYIANSGSNTVTVLDLVNLRQDRVIRVGDGPVALAANPARNEVYAVNTGAPASGAAQSGQRENGSVSVIDTASNQVAATIPVARHPVSIDLDAAGRRAYVANSASNSISVLDLTTRRQIATAGTGVSPGSVRISADEGTLVVANHGGNSVSLLDGHTLKLRQSFDGCPGPTDIRILADSSKAFIACSGGHQVMVLALARAKAGTLGYVDSADRLLAMLDVGASPVHLALKPDGGEIFVSNADSNTISEIATGTNEVGGAYLMGAHPSGSVVSEDNSLLWVSNSSADTIGVYSIDDGKLINTIHVGGGPQALALSSDGHLLLAIDGRSGDVSVVRTASRTPEGRPIYGSLFTMLPAGSQPAALVIKAFRAKH